jgi:hypothetical protein
MAPRRIPLLPSAVTGYIDPNGRPTPEFYSFLNDFRNDVDKRGIGYGIDITRLGAKCDGLHANADTAALFRARAMIESGEVRRIILPPNSTTLVNDVLALFFLAGDVEIVGFGPSSVLKAADNADLSSIISTNALSTSFTLRDITVDGNQANDGTHSSSSYGVVPQCNNVLIENCTVKNCGSTAIALNANTGVVIRNCIIKDNQVQGVTYVGSAPTNVKIHNNDFERNYNTTTITDSSAINIHMTDFEIVNNRFVDNYNVSGGQFEVADGTSGTTNLNGLVQGNRVWQTGTVVGENTFGLSIYGSNVRICDNVIGRPGQNTTGAGIVTGGDNIGIAIHNNTVYSSGSAINLTFGDGGSIGTRRSSIIGNHVMTGLVGISYQAASEAGNDVVVLANYLDSAGVATRYAGFTNFSMVKGNYSADTN